MSDEQQPDLRWAPITPKPSRAKRVWLIVGLVVAALLIVGVVLFFLLPRGDGPEPGASQSPTSTPTATPRPTPTETVTPEPSITPIDTPPAVDPSVESFRGQVSGWLGDAGRGLDLVAGSSGQDALPVVDTLQEDAQRLSDTPAPSSIATTWQNGVDSYLKTLTDLRSALSSGADPSAALTSARDALSQLRTVVGL